MLPSRSTVRCGLSCSAAPTWSAISASLPETDSMSTSARVRATGSARMSVLSMSQDDIVRGVDSSLRDRPAWGFGLATVTDCGQVRDTWYPAGSLGLGSPGAGPAPAEVPQPGLAGLRAAWVVTLIGSLADPPKDAPDGYLRLHLLSHRLIQPHDANLDGIFGLLANVA